MRVSQEIKSYGFKGIAAMKTHSTREIMDLCENAESLYQEASFFLIMSIF